MSTFRSLMHAFPTFICDRFIVFDTLIIMIGIFDAIYFWVLKMEFEASALNMVPVGKCHEAAVVQAGIARRPLALQWAHLEGTR